MRLSVIAGEYGIDLRAMSCKGLFKFRQVDAGILQGLIDFRRLRESGSADQRVVGRQVLPLPLRCECRTGSVDGNATKYGPFLKNHGDLLVVLDESMNARCQLAAIGAVIVEI